jgi:hypothetical protein
MLPDGYTVSDVVMYWRSTPIRGVEEAELPQFTILGYETNDRKVREKFVWLTFGITSNFCFQGKTSHRSLSETFVVIQTSEKHRIFHFSNLLAQHSHCDAVVGVLLDQSRGYERESSIR